MEPAKSPWWAYAMWSLGAVILLGVVAGIVIVADMRIGPGCKLDKERWAKARNGVGNEAWELAEPEVEDLVKCDDLAYGKTRPEIVHLLGKPDREPEGLWYYDVGIPGMLSDYPGLEVRFDETGRVAEVSVPDYIER